MADTSNQEKTERATPKRKKDARKKGQLPRSKEIVSFILLLSSAGLLYLFSQEIYNHFCHILQQGFILHQHQALDLSFILAKAKQLIVDAFMLFIPFFIIAVLAVYLGNIILSGHIFSFEKLKPKLSNTNPISGIKKLFSIKGLSELLQAVLKVSLIGLITALIITAIHPQFLLMSLMPLEKSMHILGHQLLFTFLLLAASTLIIALIDLPLQLYQNQKQLKMTKQEVKDEMKQTDGNPEIKGKLRQLQRQAARRSKMLQDLPKADIVITNPTHFAVALQYDDDSMSAPVILAMGSGFMALNIRKLSTEHAVPILHIAPLARALYYHGEIGEQIPEGLFHAVAQVLAYIFQLDDPLQFHLDKQWIDQLPIPEELTNQEKQK